jgi:WD40 repeat protein
MKLELESIWGGTSMRHGAEVNALVVGDEVAFAADGGQPGTAVAWDLATGDARVTVKSTTYGLVGCAVADDGKGFAIDGYDNRAWVYNRDGKRLHAFTTRGTPRALAFSPDGRWLLVGDDRTPRLFPLAGGEPRALKGHRSFVSVAAWSPDGGWVATAAGDAQIKLQNVAKAKVYATISGYANVLAFLRDGTQLLHAGFGGAAIVDVPTGELVRKLDFGAFACVAISRDGKRVALRATSDQRAVKVVDLESGAKLFERAFDPIRHAVLDRTGERLVVARAAQLAQGTSLEVWSVAANERLLPKGEGHEGGVVGLEVRGRVAVSASADRSIKIWDLEMGREVETLLGTAELHTLAVAPDARVAVTTRSYGRESATIERWDLAKLTPSGAIDTADLGNARALAISPDGRTAAASFVRRAALFDLATGERRAVLEKHKAQVDAIAFSHDGRYVVTGAADHLVKVWRVDDGSMLHALTGHGGFVHAIACLPDGSAVSASSEMIRWDLTSGQQLSMSTSRGEVRRLASSPDGRWLVVIPPFDQRVELWPTTLEAAACALELDEAPSVAAFANDRTVLVGTKSGRIVRLALVT